MFLLSRDYWEIRNAKNKGRGVFAKKNILSRTVVGDYTGKLLGLEEIDFAKEKRNLYLMYYNDDTGIYPNLTKPGVYLINHSCKPNCWLKVYKKHTLVFALKDIKKGEELTINYLLPPKKGCKNCTHRCFCKSPECTGSMHLSEEKYKKWQRFQMRERKGRKNKRTNRKFLKSLSKYPPMISKSYITKVNKLGVF